MTNSVELTNVTVSLGGREVLSHITVALPERGFHIVFGPNGGGKTSLVRTIIGELKPESGSVKLFDQDPKKSRTQVGYVPQRVQARRNFPITAEKAVLMGTYGQVGLFKRPNKTDWSKVWEIMERVGLSGLEKRPLSELSGGQRQRVFLARALATEPKLLILDEAMSGVDVGMKERLYELLSSLKESMAVIFVTHDMSVVSRSVDTVLCLDKTLVSHGKPEEALTQEALSCMYGSNVALFSHCEGAHHIHVPEHRDD